ncbi:MAG: PulJ/GspJ family protein [Planctomycetota bacterium]|jgi:prepilin-type N-terminal cleavage/methylation domain-containing protein
MRKGFSMVEMLAVIAVLSIVSVALSGLFTTVIKDIPRSYRVIQTNTTLLNMLKHMGKDIDAARRLPESFEEYTADGKVLLIELADGVVRYQLKDDEVIRHRLTNVEEGSSEGTIVWPLPHAKIKWQVWKKNGKGYAVEVKTHIEQVVRGRWQKKMRNCHLYFVGVLERL